MISVYILYNSLMEISRVECHVFYVWNVTISVALLFETYGARVCEVWPGDFSAVSEETAGRLRYYRNGGDVT